MALFEFAQATTMYSLPGTNHDLTQEKLSNYYLCQRKYFNTSIKNTTDSISALDKISNPVTADDAYPDENLHRTLFRFIADTNNTL